MRLHCCGHACGHASVLPNLASTLWSLPLHVKPPRWRPPARPLQFAGTDSLAGDRLGVFNLSSDGHAACVSHMMSYGVPLMLLGGGGGWVFVYLAARHSCRNSWCHAASDTVNAYIGMPVHCTSRTIRVDVLASFTRHPAGYKIINVARCWARETGAACPQPASCRPPCCVNSPHALLGAATPTAAPISCP